MRWIRSLRSLALRAAQSLAARGCRDVWYGRALPGIPPPAKWSRVADSYNFNPHKWMFTNFDCNCFWVADRKALIQTLSILPEYLRNQATESGAVIDYRDWHIQLGRRFRSLKLWFVIRHYGVEGLQHHIRRHVELAQQFAEWVRDDNDFELAAPAR
jgi:aromatic-L-amino-acid/L-tryptophan decarboxylase